MIGSAVLAGVEPWAYLRAVVDELSAGVSSAQLADLAPDRWAAAQASPAAASTSTPDA